MLDISIVGDVYKSIYGHLVGGVYPNAYLVATFWKWKQGLKIYGDIIGAAQVRSVKTTTYHNNSLQCAARHINQLIHPMLLQSTESCPKWPVRLPSPFMV